MSRDTSRPSPETAPAAARVDLHAAARERAQALRREAIQQSIDTLEAMLARAADHAARSARRYAQRLARHRRLRDAATNGGCC